MKTKYFFIAVASAMLSMPLMAQNNKPADNKRPDMQRNREHMKEMQVNQVVSALMLDDAAAAKFRPVYENYLKELGEARTYGMKNKEANKEKNKDQVRKDGPREPQTDAQIEEGIKNRFAQSRKMLDVREKYYTEFRNQLTPRQILKVYQLEKGNTQKIQKEFKKRMDNPNRRSEGKKPDNRKDTRKDKETATN